MRTNQSDVEPPWWSFRKDDAWAGTLVIGDLSKAILVVFDSRSSSYARSFWDFRSSSPGSPRPSRGHPTPPISGRCLSRNVAQGLKQKGRRQWLGLRSSVTVRRLRRLIGRLPSPSAPFVSPALCRDRSARPSLERASQFLMPSLPCPHCGKLIEVATSRAGAETECPQCQQAITVPKLGELRRIDAAVGHQPAEMRSVPDTAAGRVSPAGATAGRRFAFVACVATAALAAALAAFCLLRYWAITVPGTTESHVEMVENAYVESSAADLVPEWEEIEGYGADIATPYPYQAVAAEKSAWLRKGLLGVAGMLVASLLAGFTVLTGRRS